MAKKAVSKQSGNPGSKRNVLELITGEGCTRDSQGSGPFLAD